MQRRGALERTVAARRWRAVHNSCSWLVAFSAISTFKLHPRHVLKHSESVTERTTLL